MSSFSDNIGVNSSAFRPQCADPPTTLSVLYSNAPNSAPSIAPTTPLIDESVSSALSAMTIGLLLGGALVAGVVLAVYRKTTARTLKAVTSELDAGGSVAPDYRSMHFMF